MFILDNIIVNYFKELISNPSKQFIFLLGVLVVSIIVFPQKKKI